LKFGLGILAATTLALSTPVLAEGSEELEKQFRIFMSCSAYAVIRTAEFPETISVYKDQKPAVDAGAQERARTGMLWTNRAFFSGRLGGQAFSRLNGRPPSNGELSDARGQWTKLLNDAPVSQREAIHTNCKSIYEKSDEV
jgi:hypothetical protein